MRSGEGFADDCLHRATTLLHKVLLAVTVSAYIRAYADAGACPRGAGQADGAVRAVLSLQACALVASIPRSPKRKRQKPLSRSRGAHRIDEWHDGDLGQTSTRLVNSSFPPRLSQRT